MNSTRNGRVGNFILRTSVKVEELLKGCPYDNIKLLCT